MRTIEQLEAMRQLHIVELGEDGLRAYLYVTYKHSRPKKAMVIASWGGGWDHVSVSFKDRSPMWAEMCQVKDVFFAPEECVIEYHPAKSEYINTHPYCLHMWRPQGLEIPTPPIEFV